MKGHLLASHRLHGENRKTRCFCSQYAIFYSRELRGNRLAVAAYAQRYSGINTFYCMDVSFLLCGVTNSNWERHWHICRQKWCKRTAPTTEAQHKTISFVVQAKNLFYFACCAQLWNSIRDCQNREMWFMIKCGYQTQQQQQKIWNKQWLLIQSYHGVWNIKRNRKQRRTNLLQWRKLDRICKSWANGFLCDIKTFVGDDLFMRILPFCGYIHVGFTCECVFCCGWFSHK